MGYQMQWVDTHDLAAVREALAGTPAVLVVETISNPLGRVCELDRIIAMAHRHGVRVLVDNTFATPFHATPPCWGADLVVHSVTKFIGGHRDLILGAAVGSKGLIARAAAVVDSADFTPDPFSAWLALRGGRTLALRMRKPAWGLTTAWSGFPSASSPAATSSKISLRPCEGNRDVGVQRLGCERRSI